MCRSEADHEVKTSRSSSETQEGSRAEAAAKHTQPNSPRSSCLNPEDTLSVVLLDWDDTLFPTTALTSLGPEGLADEFEAIDTVVSELLQLVLAMQNCCVVILTNAKASWVEHCADTFLPKVNTLLRSTESGRFCLISAHRNRASLPADIVAYEDAVRRQKSEAVRPLAVALQNVKEALHAEAFQVISVGDQPHDLAAAHALRRLMQVEESFVKTVLMKPQPSANEVLGQLRAFRNSVPNLLKWPRDSHQSMHQTRARLATPPQQATEDHAGPMPVPVQA